MRIDLAGRILPGIAIALALGACTKDAPTESELSPGAVGLANVQVAEDSVVVPVPDDVGKPGEVCIFVGEEDDPDRVGDCVSTPSLLGTLKLFYTAGSASGVTTISGCGFGKVGVQIYIPAVSAGASVRAQFVSEGDLPPQDTENYPVPDTTASSKPVAASACR